MAHSIAAALRTAPHQHTQESRNLLIPATTSNSNNVLRCRPKSGCNAVRHLRELAVCHRFVLTSQRNEIRRVAEDDILEERDGQHIHENRCTEFRLPLENCAEALVRDLVVPEHRAKDDKFLPVARHPYFRARSEGESLRELHRLQTRLYVVHLRPRPAQVRTDPRLRNVAVENDVRLRLENELEVFAGLDHPRELLRECVSASHRRGHTLAALAAEVQ